MNENCKGCDESHLEGSQKTARYCQAMDEIVDAVGQQVQISNDFLSLGIVFAVIVVIFFVILI